MLADVALIDWNKLPTHWSSVRECSLWVALKRGVCVPQRSCSGSWRRNALRTPTQGIGMWKRFQSLILFSSFIHTCSFIVSCSWIMTFIIGYIVLNGCLVRIFTETLSLLSCLCRLHFKDKNKGASFNFHIKYWYFFQYWKVLKNIFFQIRPNLPQFCDILI